MSASIMRWRGFRVALRKESVDRNVRSADIDGAAASLSARRAWIEIKESLAVTAQQVVALRKESVDRNECFKWIKHKYPGCRSPQGERG